jgi:hypothetical protein
MGPGILCLGLASSTELLFLRQVLIELDNIRVRLHLLANACINVQFNRMNVVDSEQVQCCNQSQPTLITLLSNIYAGWSITVPTCDAVRALSRLRPSIERTRDSATARQCNEKKNKRANKVIPMIKFQSTNSTHSRACVIEQHESDECTLMPPTTTTYHMTARIQTPSANAEWLYRLSFLGSYAPIFP